MFFYSLLLYHYALLHAPSFSFASNSVTEFVESVKGLLLCAGDVCNYYLQCILSSLQTYCTLQQTKSSEPIKTISCFCSKQALLPEFVRAAQNEKIGHAHGTSFGVSVVVAASWDLPSWHLHFGGKHGRIREAWLLV